MFFKKTDIIIIFVIIAASAVSFAIYRHIASERAAVAQIYYYSELVSTVELNTKTDKTFSVPQNNNVVFHLFDDGSICFEESDCPDKVCIKSGRLRLAGQSAACLPNGFILKIVPKGEYEQNDVDLVVGK